MAVTSAPSLRRVGILAGRALLYGVLLLLLVRGGISLVRPAGERGAAPSASSANSFPILGAQAFAARFTTDYLTYDESASTARAALLSAYLPAGTDPTLGWDGKGKQVAASAMPVGIEVTSPRTALVTVSAEVSGPRWVYLSVPLAADGTGFVVSGSPALVPPPLKASPPPLPAVRVDAALSTELRPRAEAFFKAFASGSDASLEGFLAPGATVIGLTSSTVELASLTSLQVQEGAPDRRQATAQVQWRDRTSRAQLTQSYALELVLSAGRWFVGHVSGTA